jgi:hypothetical protein
MSLLSLVFESSYSPKCLELTLQQELLLALPLFHDAVFQFFPIKNRNENRLH